MILHSVCLFWFMIYLVQNLTIGGARSLKLIDTFYFRQKRMRNWFCYINNFSCNIDLHAFKFQFLIIMNSIYSIKYILVKNILKSTYISCAARHWAFATTPRWHEWLRWRPHRRPPSTDCCWRSGRGTGCTPGRACSSHWRSTSCQANGP